MKFHYIEIRKTAKKNSRNEKFKEKFVLSLSFSTSRTFFLHLREDSFGVMKILTKIKIFSKSLSDDVSVKSLTRLLFLIILLSALVAYTESDDFKRGNEIAEAL